MLTCNHAWLWRTRSRVKVTQLVVIWLHSLTQKMQEKKKHRSSMYTTRETLKSDVFFHFRLVGCQDDVIRRHMTSSNVTLTLLSHAWHIFREIHQRIFRYSYFSNDSNQKCAPGGKILPPYTLWVLNNYNRYYYILNDNKGCLSVSNEPCNKPWNTLNTSLFSYNSEGDSCSLHFYYA